MSKTGLVFDYSREHHILHMPLSEIMTGSSTPIFHNLAPNTALAFVTIRKVSYLA